MAGMLNLAQCIADGVRDFGITDAEIFGEFVDNSSEGKPESIEYSGELYLFKYNGDEQNES